MADLRLVRRAARRRAPCPSCCSAAGSGARVWLGAAGRARDRRPARRRLAARGCGSRARCRRGCGSASRWPADLFVTNAGRRTVHGILRDAWQPSAGARPRARAARAIRAPASGASSRPRSPRSAAASGARPTSRCGRSGRCGSRRARRPSAVAGLDPRAAAVQRRASTCRRGWRGCASSTAATSVHGARPGHRVRQPARVRARRRRALARLAGDGAARRPGERRRASSSCAPGGPSATAGSCIVIDTGRTSAARIADEPRIDTAFEASLLLAALASRAGDRVDLLIYDRRVRGRVQGATGAELLARMVTRWRPSSPSSSSPTGAAVPGLVRSGDRRSARSSCC